MKERGIRLLVKRAKSRRSDKVLLATGIREDESIIPMRYKDREINRTGAQVWANPPYWWSREERDDYLTTNQLIRNPVSRELGISGECLCGAFANPGEFEKVRAVDPDVAARLERLHAQVKDKFPRSWEGRPPKAETKRPVNIGPLRIGCEKSAVVQAAMLDLAA